MINKSIFSFRDYRTYLKSVLQAQTARGLTSALAQACNCKPAHISMVLSEKNELSLDQAIAAGSFLSLSDAELEFFLLLVQRAKAGTEKLRAHLDGKIEKMRQAGLSLTNVSKAHALPSEDLAKVYYSSWEYAAVHILLTIPKFRTLPAIAKRLGLSSERTGEVLRFLVQNGAAKESGERFLPSIEKLHIPHKSPAVAFHHLNWRHIAIQNSMKASDESLHYTSVVSLSKEDMILLRDRILTFVKEQKQLVTASREEELACINLDFFPVRA